MGHRPGCCKGAAPAACRPPSDCRPRLRLQKSIPADKRTIQVPRPGSETHPAFIDIDRKSKFQPIPAPGQGQVIIMERIPSGVWRDGRAGSRENRVRQAQLAQFLESVRLTGAAPGTAIINGQDLELASYLYTWI